MSACKSINSNLQSLEELLLLDAICGIDLLNKDNKQYSHGILFVGGRTAL